MLKNAAARFLERTETVRVRIPIAPVDPDHPDFDPEARAAFAAHDQAREAKEEAAKDWEQAKSGRRKLADPEPVEPDWAALDDAIEEASAALDAYSIVVVLEYKDGPYSEAWEWSRTDEGKKASLSDLHLRIAEGLFARVEVLDGGEWATAPITWEQVKARTTDGEKAQIGQAAFGLCTDPGAAGPFKRRGKASAAT